MDNLGRDMQRMMWALVIGGAMAGAGAAAAVIYVIQRLRG